jgi:hypothetical protein
MTRIAPRLLLLAASGCAATDRAFPLRDPMTVDKDMRPVAIACRLVASLYDLGPARGYRPAGLERPQP